MAYVARKPVKKRVARTTTMPAPVDGWNARDALAAMGPLDAVTMTNWIPGTTDVYLRYGRDLWSTGLSGQVDTLIDHVSASATEKLWGISGTTIYNCTTQGAAVAYATAPVPTLTNARWQYVNMASSGGVYCVMAVNGADKLIGCIGSTWNQDGDASTLFDITGVNTNTCIHINVHKFRVWMVQKDTLDAWYLATGAIKGAATKFTLNGVARNGGYLMAMATWTIDAGYGVDDHAVFITSKGEVIVYSGTDPAAASTWQLVGVFQIGSPVARRCYTKFAGDLLIICHDGVVPLSGALQSSRTNPKVSLSDKIQFALSSAIGSYENNFGWEVQSYPRDNLILVNIPIQAGAYQQQYVMSTLANKPWCRFTGWDFNCLELYDDFLYGGGNTAVYRCWKDTFGNPILADDNATGIPQDISGDLQQAFSYLSGPTQLKRLTMMRPTLSTTSSQPPLLGGVNMDFDLTSPVATLTGPAASGGSAWDTSDWDTTSWAGGFQIVRLWQGVSGLGYACAPHYVIQSQQLELKLMATDIVYEVGGIL